MAAVVAEPAVRFDGAAVQHVAVDHAHVAGDRLAAAQRRGQGTLAHAPVAASRRLAAAERDHGLRGIPTRARPFAEPREVLHAQRVGDLARLQRPDPRDVRADETRRVRALEVVHLDALQVAQVALVVAGRAQGEVDPVLGQLLQQLDAGLQVRLATLHRERRVAGQRRAVHAVHEDRRRLLLGAHDLADRSLPQQRPQAGVLDRLHDRGAVALGLRQFGELFLATLRRGVPDHDAQQEPPFAELDLRDLAGRWRAPDEIAVELVEEQRLTGLHQVAFLDQRLRLDADELGGLDGDGRRFGSGLQLRLGPPGEREVEALGDRVGRHPIEAGGTALDAPPSCGTRPAIRRPRPRPACRNASTSRPHSCRRTTRTTGGRRSRTGRSPGPGPRRRAQEVGPSPIRPGKRVERR